MLKEIFEQPESIVNTMRGRVRDGNVVLGGMKVCANYVSACSMACLLAWRHEGVCECCFLSPPAYLCGYARIFGCPSVYLSPYGPLGLPVPLWATQSACRLLGYSVRLSPDGPVDLHAYSQLIPSDCPCRSMYAHSLTVAASFARFCRPEPRLHPV